MSSLNSDRSGTRARGRPRTTETAGASLVEILNLVRTGRATTRQDIERIGEFGRAVVTDRLGILAETGLLDERELGAASGGRAPRRVRFVADRGRVLVATLTQAAVGVGVADLSGRTALSSSRSSGRHCATEHRPPSSPRLRTTSNALARLPNSRVFLDTDVISTATPARVSNSSANLLPTGRKLADNTPPAAAERAWAKVSVFMAGGNYRKLHGLLKSWMRGG